ncbi:MAG: nuclear transport factor 2 family protein [Alphaproteobacteria bacterium]
MADLEARFAISELRSKYCWYTVRGFRDDVVDLFTEDGMFQNSRNTQGDVVTVAGRQALQDYFTRMKPARRIPVVMNEVTHVKGDLADGTCAMQSLGEEGFCGHYIDHFRKVNGTWLFSRRQFFPYWPIFRPDTDRRHP